MGSGNALEPLLSCTIAVQSESGRRMVFRVLVPVWIWQCDRETIGEFMKDYLEVRYRVAQVVVENLLLTQLCDIPSSCLGSR